MLSYRLGLDMGTSSLGWCIIQLDKDGNPIKLVQWGSRIFNDGREPAKKDVPGESSAVQRRNARGMRRRYDRKLMRKKATLSALIRHGLLPTEKSERKKLESLNPLQLRAEALERKLEPYEIGRTLFHLQQRRGFKSNRKDSQKSGNDLTPMKEASRDLAQDLEAKHQTLGQFLYTRLLKRENTRVRPRMEKSKLMYDGYYPTRKMVEDEFNAIWETQAKSHPALLTEEARKALQHAIFFQRKLKPQEVGKCTLVPTEKRIAWAMPSAQRFRIIKEVNNLKIRSPQDYQYKGEELDKRQQINLKQKQKLFEELCTKGSMTFGAIRRLLQIPAGTEFNLEATRDKLLGDKTSEIMRRDTHFGGQWTSFTLEEQDSIVAKLLNDDSDSPDFMEDETLTAWLMEHYRLSATQAENVANANLPVSHASFGKTVIDFIMPKMINDGLLEHAAIAAKPEWHHSQHYTGEIMPKLPYYGEVLEQHVVPMPKSSDPLVHEFGSINNPTVHISLNQLRRLMNRLKDRYGNWPQEITLEMARDLKKGRTEIAGIIKEIDKNTKKKEAWKKDIEKYTGKEATAQDYAKMKLWEELAKDPMHRQCVYTGDTISIEMLFNGKTQIDHILPRSKTLDDTSANLILATIEGNQIKKNQTPYEAFKHQSGKYSYENVCSRLESLPQSKRWRFQQDAMEIFDSKAKKIVTKSSLGTDIIVDTGLESFAARQLNDTSYMAKLAKKYLAYACKQGECGVMATPGTLTGLLRKSWGLNALLGDDDTKNRNDHRHHAVDALVIAMTTRSMVQKVASAAAREENEGINIKKILGEEKPVPVADWNALKTKLDEIVVSHKPDHGSPGQGKGTSGRLHEDTYYGYVGKGKKKGNIELVVRVAIDSFDKFEHLDDIRDKALRQQVKDYVEKHAIKNDKDEISKDGLKKTLAAFSKEFGVNRVRTLVEKSRDVMVNPKGTSYKWMQGGSNQRAEIYCPKTGKKAGKWQMEIIKTFDANQPDFVPQWRQELLDAELIMVLHSNDMVAYEEEGKTIISRVRKINTAGAVVLVDQLRAKLDNNEGWPASGKGLQEKNARRIMVEIDGSIYDPAGILTTPSDKEDVA